MPSSSYVVVIERGPSSYGVHVPDLPGCAAVGETKAEVRELTRGAIELYIEELEADRSPLRTRQPHELMKPGNCSFGNKDDL